MKKIAIPEKLANMQAVVLFDGECSLCNASVRFLLRNNKSANLNFCSLQSETGTLVMKAAAKPANQYDTLLLLQDNTLYESSDAALKIASHLRFPWNLAGMLRIIPERLRDRIYRFVARNRYKWFGKKAFCLTDGSKHYKRFVS